MCSSTTKKRDFGNAEEKFETISDETASMNPTIHSESNTSLLELEIEPVYPAPNSGKTQLSAVTEDLKYAFYKQLATQNIEMTNACILNMESVVDVHLGYNLVAQVRCCRIQKDGDCLFGSMSHQLLGGQIDSSDHQKSTSDLRQKTVSHIRNNIDEFMPYMKDRVYTHLERSGTNPREVPNMDIQAESLKFLETKLISKSTAWGGTESLKAITEIELVNILIINDDGSCNMVTDFDNKYPRSVAIFFDQANKHYDSVVSVDGQILFDLIESVLRSQMIKKQDCCIVID